MKTKHYPQDHNPGWFESFSGKFIYPCVPRLNDVDIEDIAHALSMICRYAGHCRAFYSVAQHSILVHQLVKFHTNDVNTLKYALMHDASEAYIHDITRPLKISNVMAQYRVLEQQWMDCISAALSIDLTHVDFNLVKEADNHALKIETTRLVPSGGRNWNIPETRDFPATLVCFFDMEITHHSVMNTFLNTWREYHPEVAT